MGKCKYKTKERRKWMYCTIERERGGGREGERIRVREGMEFL